MNKNLSRREFFASLVAAIVAWVAPKRRPAFSVDLLSPAVDAVVEQARIEPVKMSMRVIRSIDPNSGTVVNRIDVLCGFFPTENKAWITS